MGLAQIQVNAVAGAAPLADQRHQAPFHCAWGLLCPLFVANGP